MSPVTIEAAVDSVASAEQAVEAGAGRLELCTALGVGGLTPGAGLCSEVCRRVSVPVMVMIRVRAGGFVIDDDDLDVMCEAIAAAVDEGASGVVAGVLTPDGRVDERRLTRLVKSAGSLPFTFHRAFDAMPDRIGALPMLRDAGVRRVLTSAGADSAHAGREELAVLARAVPSPLTILPGGGIQAEHVAAILESTGGTELHLAGVAVGAGGESRPDPERIRAVAAAAAAFR